MESFRNYSVGLALGTGLAAIYFFGFIFIGVLLIIGAVIGWWKSA